MQLDVQKSRLSWLDLSKVIAVLFVIFYHSIPLLLLNNELIDIISTIIEPFHVSVFYFISGLLFVNSIKTEEDGGGDKCKRYFIKYSLLTLIWGIIQGGYIFLITKRPPLNCLIQSFYNYWFFPVLVLGYFFLFFIYKLKLKWFVVLPLWFFCFLLARNSSMLMRIIFFPFLMYIGTVFRDLKLSILKKLLICCFVYALVSTILIHFGYGSTYNGQTGFIGMVGFLNLISGSMILPFFLEYINSKKEIKLSRFVSFIGQNTLYFYILHYFLKLPLVDFSSHNGYLYFIFSFMTIVFGTSLLVFFYRKAKKIIYVT